MTKTDGHWPVMERLPEFNGRSAILCECGAKPKRLPARASMQHTWHQTHRRQLSLPRVSYVWSDEDMDAVRAGGARLSRGVVQAPPAAEVWAVIITAADGTQSVCSPFPSRVQAEGFGADLELHTTGELSGQAVLLETPAQVREQVGM